ncbi:hypothetical protein, partial [Promicromonospora sp. NPDC050262]|uniref:hypothetical protein n=1 Tax=Promicromonospora sp. NPDC050262 TaxID=3155036 RepID=UPI0034091374
MCAIAWENLRPYRSLTFCGGQDEVGCARRIGSWPALVRQCARWFGSWHRDRHMDYTAELLASVPTPDPVAQRERRAAR